MHISTKESYQYLQLHPLKFKGFTPEFIDETINSNPEINWGFDVCNTIIPFLNKLFPAIGARYVIERNSEVNAWVAPLPTQQNRPQYLISVTEGAIKFFVDYGNSFYNSHSRIFDTEEEQEILRLWSNKKTKGGLRNLLADVVSLSALAAIIGHELGHAHEGQFEASLPTENIALINHGCEFSADGWAAWVAATFVGAFVDEMREADFTDQQVMAYDLLHSTIVLGACSCIDNISLNENWNLNNPNDPINTHPADSARLMSVAVSLTEWWHKRKNRSREASSQITVRATRRILNQVTPNESDSTVLMEQMLTQYDSSSSYIGDTRDAYERWGKKN